MKTDASVAVFSRKHCRTQDFIFGKRIAVNTVVIFADAAVTAVNRADVRDFNESAVINLIAHKLGGLLIGSFLKLLAVFRFGQTEQEHDILIG